MIELRTAVDQRPEFMVYLALLPPYTLDDVHKAYKAKAREAHPDRGGSNADFLKLQEAYEQAQEYVKFQEGRRQWLSTRVDSYLHQQEVVAEVERGGGHVDVEDVNWMKRSFGDFAALAERLREIVMHDCPDGDGFLKFLAERAAHLIYLFYLDVAGSTVTDQGLDSLLELRGLGRLNLAQTRVTAEGLGKLAALPDLKWLNVSGTSLGWWARRQLRRKLPKVEIVH